MSLKTTITKEGQPYVDEPVFVSPKPELDTTIAQVVRAIFGRPPLRRILLGYQRTRLRWVKPDGKGGVVAR